MPLKKNQKFKNSFHLKLTLQFVRKFKKKKTGLQQLIINTLLVSILTRTSMTVTGKKNDSTQMLSPTQSAL